MHNQKCGENWKTLVVNDLQARLERVMSHEQDPGGGWGEPGAEDGHERGDSGRENNPNGQGQCPDDDGEHWEDTSTVPVEAGPNLIEILPEIGVCKLRSKRGGRIVAVSPYNPDSARRGEGALCRLEYPRLHKNCQSWKFVPVPGEYGWFYLRNMYQPNGGIDYLLDVYGADEREGAPVGQANNNGSVAQKWLLEPVGNGSVWFRLSVRLLSGGMWQLDVRDGHPNENQPVDISRYNGTDAQMWCAVKPAD